MVLARFFLFIFVFTIEVRVHALTVTLPNAPHPTQEPKECLLADGVCAVRTPENAKFKMVVGEASVVLDGNTTIVRNSKSSVTLVTGTIWIKSDAVFSVETEFGSFTTEQGEFWVRRNSEQAWASAVSQEVILKGKGMKTPLRLEPGEENWMGRVAANGEATTGLPRAIVFDEHITRWARLYAGKKADFESDLRAFRKQWSRQLASVAEYNHQLAEQRLKTLEEERAKEAQTKAQEEARSKELRALFRRKTMLD